MPPPLSALKSKDLPHRLHSEATDSEGARAKGKYRATNNFEVTYDAHDLLIVDEDEIEAAEDSEPTSKRASEPGSYESDRMTISERPCTCSTHIRCR